MFRDVGELRVKETDRLAAAAALVRGLRGRAEVAGDDLVVHGVGPAGPRRRDVDSGGDHRMAMAAAVAGAGRRRRPTVEGFDCVATSYPGFLARPGRPAVAASSEMAPATARPHRRHRRTGRLGQVDGVAGAGRTARGRSGSTPGPCTGRWPGRPCDRGIDPADAGGGGRRWPGIGRHRGRAGRVRIDGTDVTAAIRSPEVSRAVSVVAANPDVRRVLVARQRRWAADHGGGVVEGRDIGSVVFPDAT